MNAWCPGSELNRYVPFGTETVDAFYLWKDLGLHLFAGYVAVSHGSRQSDVVLFTKPNGATVGK